jgi:hypothetical protein
MTGKQIPSRCRPLTAKRPTAPLDKTEQNKNNGIGLVEEADVTAFFVVLGLAMLALLRMRAAASVARPDVEEAAVCTEAEVAFRDALRPPRQISRSAGVRRSFFHALRAPGPLCERAFAVTSRHAAPRAFASAAPSACADMRARAVPAPG